MELIDVTPNLTKGGSMRCCLQKINGNFKIDSVQEYIKLEDDFNLPSQKLFDDYSNKIQKHKSEFIELIKNYQKMEKNRWLWCFCNYYNFSTSL